MGAVHADLQRSDEHRRRRGDALRMTQAADVRQQQFFVRHDRPAREDRVAEVVSQLGVHRRGIVDPRHPQCVGDASSPLRVHLLEHDDVRVRQRRARREHVDRAVDVFAPLHVVGHHPQQVTAGSDSSRRGRRAPSGVARAERALVIDDRATAPRPHRGREQQNE